MVKENSSISENINFIDDFNLEYPEFDPNLNFEDNYFEDEISDEEYNNGNFLNISEYDEDYYYDTIYDEDYVELNSTMLDLIHYFITNNEELNQSNFFYIDVNENDIFVEPYENI